MGPHLWNFRKPDSGFFVLLNYLSTVYKIPSTAKINCKNPFLDGWNEIPYHQRRNLNSICWCWYLQVHVGSDLLDFGPLFSGEKSLGVGEVEVVELEVGGDGGLSPDLGELGVVSQNQSAQDHVLDDGVEKEVEGTNTCRQAEED